MMKYITDILLPNQNLKLKKKVWIIKL